MATAAFGLEDQLAFAALSGDYNPIHVDPVAARRLMFGEPVVHGVRTLLWSLDRWAAGRPPFALLSLKVVFAKPLLVGRTIELGPPREEGDRVRLSAVSGPDTVARVDLRFAPAGPAEGVPSRRFEPAPAIERTAYAGATGALPLVLDAEGSRRLFPNLTAAAPAAQLATLLASTRLVGMECPGLHSVFSELELIFEPAAPVGDMTYEVVRHDERFSLLTIKVASPAASGLVRAFVRPAPRSQASFADARALVRPDEFAGTRALVVGGSRGLGETAAKLLAAGGADVLVTFARGEADARRLADEIRDGGGRAETARLDVLDGAAPSLPEGWSPTHLYYFATPFIATGRKGAFSRPLFERFCDHYVHGFAALLAHLPGLQAAYNPSSVFVEDPPDGLAEYAAAKAAAELVGRGGKVRIDRPRLPKMGTDQTASLSGDGGADPTPVMLRSLRAFAAAGG